eukprot:3617185-Pleurochrysis_carterae.AAC.1
MRLSGVASKQRGEAGEGLEGRAGASLACTSPGPCQGPPSRASPLAPAAPQKLSAARSPTRRTAADASLSRRRLAKAARVRKSEGVVDARREQASGGRMSE